MLDLLAVGTLDSIGTIVGAAASMMVDGIVDDTERFASANTFSLNATLLLLGFLLGLVSEMRGNDS